MIFPRVADSAPCCAAPCSTIARLATPIGTRVWSAGKLLLLLGAMFLKGYSEVVGIASDPEWA